MAYSSEILCCSDDWEGDRKEGGAEGEKVHSENLGDGFTIESNWDQVVESFDEMGLKEELLRGIYAYGYVGCHLRAGRGGGGGSVRFEMDIYIRGMLSDVCRYIRSSATSSKGRRLYCACGKAYKLGGDGGGIQ